MALGIGFGVNWGSISLGPGNGGAPIDERFIITVKTDNAGTSASNQFTLPWIGTYDVDWGDGNVDTGVTDAQTHTYATAGTYDVAVTANTGQIQFNNGGDKDKLLEIKSWGNISWNSLNSAFEGCGNLDFLNTINPPNLSNCTDIRECFKLCLVLGNVNGGNIDLSSWDVSNVLNFQEFYLAYNFNNLNISGWNINPNANIVMDIPRVQNLDVSNITFGSRTSLARMFEQDRARNYIGLGTWDVSGISNFTGFYSRITESNVLGLDGVLSWNFQDGCIISQFFFGLNKQSNIYLVANNLNVKPSSTSGCFGYSGNSNLFNNLDLNGWDMSLCTNVSEMFRNITGTFQQDLFSTWDITNISNFSNFFSNTAGLLRENYDATLIAWEATLQATYPNGAGYPHNITIDFGNSQYSYEGRQARQSLIDNFGWTIVDGGEAVRDEFVITVKTDNAGTSGTDQFTIPTSTTGITQAFLYDIETSDGQTITGVTGNHTITFPTAGTYEVRISGSFPYMRFANGGDKSKLLDIKNFGIYALGSTSQSDAFRGCSNMDITATDIGNFGSVNNFSNSWLGCSNLTSFPLIDTSGGTNFSTTWFGCSSLTSFPLIDTSSGTRFDAAWQGCSSLTSFPLLDTSSGTLFTSAWRFCTSLASFPLIDTSSGISFEAAWNGCTSLANYPANAFDTNIATNYTNAFATTNLTTQSIDDILVSLDTSGVTNGTFLQSGGQAPSATGEAAIDNLVSKGWTIVVTGGYDPTQFFIFTVKTDNAGTSGTNQFTIPTSTTGITQAFLYDIETSDGQTITGLTGDHTITFPSAGTYDIYISGSFPYMYFNNGGDKLKLLDIKNFGIYALGSTKQERAFHGCSNMVITATDNGNFGSVTNFIGAWRDCSSLTSFPTIDTSSGVDFDLTWFNCSSLTSFPLIDTSSGVDFQFCWLGCSSLTSFPLLDTSNGTRFLQCWQGCSSLTSFPANAFDSNIATDYASAFGNTSLTTQSIDDILVSLDTSGVSNGTFTQSGGQAPSATGETAIDNLVSKGWTIVVTGGYTPPSFTTNLVASYSFDTDFSDYTGNNNLTAIGNAIAGVASGKVSNCAELDGTSDYTIAADSDDFSFTNGTNDLPFSISFWANFLTHSQIQGDASWIITKRDASTNEEYQVAFWDNKFQFWLFSQGTASAYVAATLPFIPITGGTTWQHFTVTYDGSQTFSGIKMYIDGVSQTLTDSSVGTYLGMINGSASINIGSQGWNPTLGEFDGKLDEFHVWKNRELTSAEVLEIYNTENAGNSILP